MEKSLLSNLQTALAGAYGNTIIGEDDRPSHKDQYECFGCKALVDESDWNSEALMCKSCWKECWE